jgi:hypothetical protein
MRVGVRHYLAGLALLALTMPVWARTYKEELTLDKTTTIGGTQLKAGSYELTADDAKSEVAILQNGKVLATVQAQWIKLPQKAPYSSFVSDGDKITQVDFSGSEEAIQLQ